MITGFATGVPTDANEEMLLGFIPSYELGTSFRAILPIQPAVGCGNQFWVFGADEQVQKIQYITEGSFQKITVLLNPTRTTHSVFAEPNGTWNSIGSINIFEPTLDLTASNGKTISGSFTTSSEFIDTFGDNGQLTSWSLIGLERYSTLRPDGLKRTEAECDVTITSVGTTHTVTILLNGVILAQGSRVGNGTVTLTQVNQSGVSGTVTLTWSADIPSYDFVDAMDNPFVDANGNHFVGS